MTYSIHHFFQALVQKRAHFVTIAKLDQFPFPKRLLACTNTGVFPDLAIRLNKDRTGFTGGELIELKDSDSYTVASFNSTIPSGKKDIRAIVTGEKGIIRAQMEKAGNDIFSLLEREVYYLVRGRKHGHTKVCLVHGSFFATISPEKLISSAFNDALQERLRESGKALPADAREALETLFSEQQTFSKVRDVEKASVKLRFRIMTEVKAEGNILNSKVYPDVKDDTLNLVLSCHDRGSESAQHEKLRTVFPEEEIDRFTFLKLKHPFNGYFLIVQIPLYAM